MNRAYVLFALFALACANPRSTACRANTDCASGMQCLSGRCFPQTSDAGRDGAMAPTDAGHDAAIPADAFVMPADDAGRDGGHDAAVVLDGGHDAGRDGGHDAGNDAGNDAARVSTGALLIFSEYVEGSGNNKALEIANVGTTRVDLTACTIDLYTNGSHTAASTALTGSLSAGSVYTVCNPSAAGFSPSSCSLSSATATGFNGNDAIALVCDGVTLDVIGQIGSNPGTSWGTTVTTVDETLRRNCSVSMGDTNGSDAFDPASEWTSAGMDVFDGLGTRGCP